MKTKISAIIALAIIITLFPGSDYCAASGPGVWVLVDKSFRGYSGDGSLTTETIDGSVVETIISGKNRIVGTASWSRVPESIPSGQIFSITLTAMINDMKWDTKKAFGSTIKASVDSAETSPGFMSSSGYYLTDEKGKYAAEAIARDSKIVIATETLTVSGTLNEGSDGDRLAIIFSTSLNGGAKYIYEFSEVSNPPLEAPTITDISTESPEPVGPETKVHSIQLSGVVLGIKDRPMRNMRIIIDPSFGESFTTKTDSNGYYSYNGTIRPVDGEAYTFKVQLQFAYIHDSLNPSDGWVFYLKSNVEDPVKVETTMTILPEQLVSIPESGLVLSRDIKFSDLAPNGCISYSISSMGDTFYSMSPKEKIYGYTNVYDALSDAIYTGVTVFNEKTAMASGFPLIVNVDDASADAYSHFDFAKPTGYMNLIESNSTVSDTTRSVIYHEFGHFLDYYSNGKAFRGSIDRKLVLWDSFLTNKNDWHNGFLNSDSSFSVFEGYATWYASMVRKHGLYPEPNYYVIPGITDLSSKVTKAWRDMLGEEFAIASFYLRLEKGFGLDEIWKIMKIDRDNFYETYKEVLKTPLGATHKSKIQNIAFGLGLFSHPVGNGELDPFEYYIDFDGSGFFEPGGNDILFDLMYDSYGNKLTGATKEAILEGIGRTSDSVRGREIAPTTLQYDNMYVMVTRDINWNYARVAVYAEGEEPYAYIADISKDGVYLPLPIGYSGGYVEISVPGGALLWRGDIGEIIDHYYRTIGSNEPIAIANLDAASLPPPGGVVEPIEGNIDMDGYYILMPNSEYFPSIGAWGEDSEFGLPEYSLESEDLGFDSPEFDTILIDSLSYDNNSEIAVFEEPNEEKELPLLIMVLVIAVTGALVGMFMLGRRSKK